MLLTKIARWLNQSNLYSWPVVGSLVQNSTRFQSASFLETVYFCLLVILIQVLLTRISIWVSTTDCLAPSCNVEICTLTQMHVLFLSIKSIATTIIIMIVIIIIIIILNGDQARFITDKSLDCKDNENYIDGCTSRYVRVRVHSGPN